MEPTPNYLYIHDDTGRVLCGTHLDDEFDGWPDDWSEIAVAVRGDYECDECLSEKQ